MVIDPLLRSSWLFYVVFPGQNQHSAATSFFLALGEVFRRFMWNFFRMENEHMTNVGHFLAARDVPLPFSLPSVSGPPGGPTLEAQPPLASSQSSLTTRTMGSIRRGMVRMTSSLRLRHAEDFARRPGPDRGPQKGKLPDDTEISSDNEQGKRPMRDVQEHENCEACGGEGNPGESTSVQCLSD
jgi:xenotropic and polytropic retrovirus receptor 1